jgi:hypothetical protein
VWLDDYVITEDSPRGYLAGWEFLTREFPGGFSPPSHFRAHVGLHEKCSDIVVRF